MILRSVSVILVGRQAREVHPANVRMCGEELGNLERVGGVSLHAQVQRFQTLEEEESVEWGHSLSLVAQTLDASLDAKRNVAQAREVAKDVPQFQTVIAGIFLCEIRELAVAPVEVAAVHDQSTDRRSMSADKLCCRMDNDIRSVLQRTVQIRRGQRVVDHDRHACFLSNLGDLFVREDIQLGVAHGLAVDELDLRSQRAAEVLGIAGVHKVNGDAHLRQRVMEEVVGSSIQTGAGDHLIAGLKDVCNSQCNGSLARSGGDARSSTLQSGDALLQNVGGRVHDAGVDVAELLQGKQPRRMRRVIENVAGRLIDRYGAGLGSWVHILPAVQSDRFQSGFLVGGGAHRCSFL